MQCAWLQRWRISDTYIGARLYITLLFEVEVMLCGYNTRNSLPSLILPEKKTYTVSVEGLLTIIGAEKIFLLVIVKLFQTAECLRRN